MTVGDCRPMAQWMCHTPAGSPRRSPTVFWVPEGFRMKLFTSDRLHSSVEDNYRTPRKPSSVRAANPLLNRPTANRGPAATPTMAPSAGSSRPIFILMEYGLQAMTYIAPSGPCRVTHSGCRSLNTASFGVEMHSNRAAFRNSFPGALGVVV